MTTQQEQESQIKQKGGTMKLMSIDIGMYGGHATHLKLYVQKDNEENQERLRFNKQKHKDDLNKHWEEELKRSRDFNAMKPYEI